MIHRPSYYRQRYKHRGLHSHSHIDRQRRMALVLIATALMRVTAWMLLTAFYLFHVPFATQLFKSVAFVALISMFALILTDWGQMAASLAQLTAGDAHHDVEAVRRDVTIDYRSVESDIARLAELHPGPEAVDLAAKIRRKLTST